MGGRVDPERFQPLKLTRREIEAGLRREDGIGIDLEDCCFGMPRPKSHPVASCSCRKCERLRARDRESARRRAENG